MPDQYFDWVRIEEKRLATFVAPDLLPDAFRWPTDESRLDLFNTKGPEAVAERLYERLRSLAIQYDLSPVTPGARGTQRIRTPETILSDKQATCLDLTVLFASMCLRCDLLPIIVLVREHALMGFSRRKSPRNATVGVWPDGWTNELRNLQEVAGDDYILVECTGAACSASLSTEFPEGCGRDADGAMSFRRACEAGLEQILQHASSDRTTPVRGQRAFVAALDVYSLQATYGLKPNGLETNAVVRNKVSRSTSPESGRLLTPAEEKNARNQYLGWLFARCNQMPPVPIAGAISSSRQVLFLELAKTFTWMEAAVISPAASSSHLEDDEEELDAEHTELDVAGSSSGSHQTEFLSEDELDHPFPWSSPNTQPISVLIARHRCLLLLGGPGSGKSTVLKYIALCLAGGGLRRKDANLETLLADAKGHSTSETPALTQRRVRGLLPLWVSLGDLADRGLPAPDQDATSDHLWRHIRAELAADLAPYVDPLRQQVATKGGILLLDGLDEFPGARDYRRQLIGMIDDFAVRHPKCRIVLTSRPHEYRTHHWSLPNFTAANLLPFSDSQRHTCADRWFSASGLKGPRADRVVFLNGFQDAILMDRRLTALSRSPLFLSLMLQVYVSDGLRPGGHIDLLERAVELLLAEWERQKPEPKTGVRESVLQILEADRAQLRERLSALALEVHRNTDHRAGSTISIPAEKLLAFMFQMSRKHGVEATDALMRLIGERAGLLEEHLPGRYRFLHKQLQEYLAACSLADAENYPANLLPLIEDNAANLWETLLLVSDISSKRQPANLWTLIDTLCPSDIETPLDETNAWRIFIAGFVYSRAVETLSQLPPHGDPTVGRLRQWLLRVIDDPTVSADMRGMSGQNLGVVGDPRPQVMTIRGMSFCYIPAGTYEAKQSDWVSVSVPYPYWIGEYPVTQAQMEEFFRDHPEVKPKKTHGFAPTGPNLPYGEPHSWPVAQAFCEWMTLEYGRYLPRGYQFCLPSEHEWAMAARGGSLIPRDGDAHIRPLDGLEEPHWKLIPNPFPRRTYPWGDEGRAYERCNCMEIQIGLTCPGCFPSGVAPYGCQDMLGNVEQWTRDTHEPHPDGSWAPEVDERLGRKPREKVVVGQGLEDFHHMSISAHAARSCETKGKDWHTWYAGFRLAICPAHIAKSQAK